MPRAAWNESEPLAGRLSSSLPVPALWGQPGGTTRVGEPCVPFSLPPRCLVRLRGKWEKRRSSGRWLSGRGWGTDAVRFGMVREGVVSCAKGRVGSGDHPAEGISLSFVPPLQQTLKNCPVKAQEGRNVGVWRDSRGRPWLGSVTDDHHWQVTKAEDVTAARLSAGVHHRSCSFTLLEQHFPRRSPVTSPALCGPRSVTTRAHYSDQPPYNWSSETKSEV